MAARKRPQRKCECGECKRCKNRLYVSRYRQSITRSTKIDLRQVDSGFFSSSLNRFNIINFYLGERPPKNGRVLPKLVQS